LEEEEMAEKITPMGEDYSRWYTDVVVRAELADYAPVKGCMIIRPYGYTLWENIQSGLDRRFKETGHVNAYFPLLIPESYLRKEAEHVEGFSPELAVVTHGGGKELEEPLVVRPTSETIINAMYAKWVRSYRDLPLLINQWANVVRWEMRTRLFLRTTEFLWQEGHTVHASAQEAQEETLRMLNVYKEFAETEMAMPVITGQKSMTEKFAGALASYSIEAMMGDTRALQSGTSHYFGQQFSKAFGIQFLNKDNELEYAYQTSWGVSTRLVGALIMVHGDDQGLIMPPRLAPVQVVIVPIWRNEDQKQSVLEATDQVRRQLSGSFRIEVDDREEYSPGWKFNEWELKGVPLRIEIGPKDVENAQVVMVRRDVAGKDRKSSAPMASLDTHVRDMLATIQSDMFQRAIQFREAHSYRPTTYEELSEAVMNGFAYAPWCGSAECEAKVKDDTKATTRCIPFDQPETVGPCIVCGAASSTEVIFARAY
jgi:prolyl-tRNA synthetase